MKTTLTPKQAEIFDLIVAYHHVTHLAMPAVIIAERLGKHHSTVMDHLAALHDKGRLVTSGTPAEPVLD